jgi:hypothetical protein
MVTAVGWRFKGPRFDIHRAALRWPESRWRYVGPNDPLDLETALRFEAIRLDGYRYDPFGAGPEPSSKRAARNPFRRFPGYPGSCPELAGLLSWQGPGPYPGLLPWEIR